MKKFSTELLFFVLILVIFSSQKIYSWEMQPLITNRKVLMWLNLCSTDKTIVEWKGVINIIFTLISVFVTLFLIASTVFFWKNISTDLELSLFALYQIPPTLGALYESAVMFFSKHKVHTIFEQLSAIYRISTDLYRFFFF